MATRVANRTRTDEVVDVLLSLEEGRWHHLDDVASDLSAWWATHRAQLTRTLLYLAHGYGAVELSPISETYVRFTVTGLATYVDGPANRTPCGCGRCGGLGEYER